MTRRAAHGSQVLVLTFVTQLPDGERWVGDGGDLIMDQMSLTYPSRRAAAGQSQALAGTYTDLGSAVHTKYVRLFSPQMPMGRGLSGRQALT